MPAGRATSERKKFPRRLAVIDADRCTGCAACMAICPPDCIQLRRVGLGVKGSQSWCEVDLDRCTGCHLCVRLPSSRRDGFVLTLCPWNAITMVARADLPEDVP